jgi:hypothetical protein
MIARYFSQAANRTGPRGADGLCRWLGGHAIADSFRKQHPRRKIVPSHTSPRIATPGFESSFLRLDLSRLPENGWSRAKPSNSFTKCTSLQPAKRPWQLTREFISSYQTKFPKACECLEKDKEVLFSFYDFPAQQGDSTKDLEEIFNLIKE